jgi:hypothetical protein
MVLTRGRERWQLVFSSGGFAATDNRGRSATGRLVGDGRRYRWDLNDQSRRVFGDSAEPFMFVTAIAADFEPRRRRRIRGVEIQEAQLPEGETNAVAQQEPPPPAAPDCAEVYRTCSRDGVEADGAPAASQNASILEGLYAMDEACFRDTQRVCCCLVGCICPCLTDVLEVIPGVDLPFDDKLGCGCTCTGKYYLPTAGPASG